VLTDARAMQGSWNLVVKTVRLTVPPCPRGESSADWTRLAGALKDAGVCVSEPNPRLCASLGSLLTAQRGDVWAVVSQGRVLEICAEAPRMYTAAFDLGTTSIAGYLIDVNEKGWPCPTASATPRPGTAAT
jgi:hypothetical protein